MRIQHNIAAMNAYRNYNNNTSALNKNLEKLSSGYKINRAGDDAAGLAISEKMRAQITGLDAAQKNVKDATSLVKTAEGAMQEIQDMLRRMKYLATQSANGTYDDEVDRANLQREVDSLLTEIDRIAENANFNGIKLLDGSKDNGIITIDSVKSAADKDNPTTPTTPTTKEATLASDELQKIGLTSAKVTGLPADVTSVEIVAAAGTSGKQGEATVNLSNGKLTITLTKNDGFADDNAMNKAVSDKLAADNTLKGVTFTGAGSTNLKAGTGNATPQADEGFAVGLAVEADTANKADNVSGTVGGDLATLEVGEEGSEAKVDWSSSSATLTAADLNNKTLTVKFGDSPTFTVTLVDASSNDEVEATGASSDGTKVFIKDDNTKAADLVGLIQTALNTQASDATTAGSVGDDAFTAVSNIALTGAANGSITATATTTPYKAGSNGGNGGGEGGGPSGPSNTTPTTPTTPTTSGASDASGLAKGSTVEFDLSSVKTISDGDTFTIGGKTFKIQKGTGSAGGAGGSGGSDPVQKPDEGDGEEKDPVQEPGDGDEGEGGGANTEALSGIALHSNSGIATQALNGTGTADDPYIVTVDDNFTKDAALDALAKAVTEKSAELGVSASYSGGKLTLTTVTDFPNATALKRALTITSNNKEVEKTWNRAINSVVSQLREGNGEGIKLQIGDTAGETLTVSIGDMHIDAMGLDGLDIGDAKRANAAIDKIKDAINYVSAVRGQLGAYQNRLDHTANNLSVMAENIQDAESTIRDTDVADEMMSYVKNNILIQSAQAMLAQANQVPQGVLQLLG